MPERISDQLRQLIAEYKKAGSIDARRNRMALRSYLVNQADNIAGIIDAAEKHHHKQRKGVHVPIEDCAICSALAAFGAGET